MLANNGIDQLKSFQWNEMDWRIPECWISCQSFQDQMKKVFHQLLTRSLGESVSYAVLLQSQKCEFSLIQQAITDLLSEKGSLKRVSEIMMTSVSTWSKTSN